MNIVVLMAGEGKRFVNVGINTPKPLITVGDKTILEWTTRSFPVAHTGEHSLFFAIRKDHRAYGISEYLHSIYGSEITIVEFPHTTRGNLETANLMMPHVKDKAAPLVILDSDNRYEIPNFDSIDILAQHEWNDPRTQAVFYFEPLDDEPKWAFAIIRDGRVTCIGEKDATVLKRGGKPMVGTFWFRDAHLFMEYAEYIMYREWRTGLPYTHEFYMSQIPALAAWLNEPVYGVKVENVIPLGTPEDVQRAVSKVAV